MIKTLEQIKDEVARLHKNKYATFTALYLQEPYPYIMKVLDDAAELYADQFKPKWNETKTNPPKHEQACIVAYRGTVQEAVYVFYDYDNEKYFVFESGETFRLEIDEVEKWQPLPTLPTDEKV